MMTLGAVDNFSIAENGNSLNSGGVFIDRMENVRFTLMLSA